LAYIWIRNEPKFDSKRDSASESLANIPKVIFIILSAYNNHFLIMI
jgi:hypothetical protein